jgi:hypothetical protein
MKESIPDVEANPVVDEEENNVEITSADRFCYRLLACSFAIGLLWLTTLSNCVYLVNLYIPTPSFSAVKKHCIDFINLVEINNHSYKQCVEEQLRVCHSDLDFAYREEMLRISLHQQNNLAFKGMFLTDVNNCTAQVSSIKSMLNAWITSDQNHTIPYYSTCQGSLKSSILASIGDQTQEKQQISSHSNSFIDSSNNNILSLINYSEELNNYNEMYLYNKTKSLHFSISEVFSINQPALLEAMQRETELILDQTQEFFQCLSLAPNTTETSCPFPNSMYSILLTMEEDFNFQLLTINYFLDDLKDTIRQYQGEINFAARNIEDFYESIIGIHGIITFLLKNGLIPAKSFLCGKSDPNYCNFEMVRKCGSTPLKTRILVFAFSNVFIITIASPGSQVLVVKRTGHPAFVNVMRDMKR